MQIYHPFYSYLRVFLISTVAGVIITLFSKNSWPVGVLIAYALGLAYILPSLIINPKIMVSDDGMLTYKLVWSTRTANLNKLTNCNYRLEVAGRGGLFMVFHLYDVDGGAVMLPANLWSNRKKLYETIAQAVNTNHVAINEKTAKKLGISSAQKIQETTQ